MSKAVMSEASMNRLHLSKVQRLPVSKWLIVILALLLIPLLLWLGVWQLQRADEKQKLLDRWSSARTDLTELPERESTEPVGVSLHGQFISDVIYLLDNRTREGRTGYEVIVPFKPDTDANAKHPVVLVNLGWLAASQYRDQLPDISLPSGSQSITGRLAIPSQAMQLSPDRWQENGRVRIQQLDMDRLALRHPGLYPAVIRIDKPLLSGLSVGWPVVNMTPERHVGYAIQWFGLAIVLMGGCSWLVLHRKEQV
ncbi:SURF1 family protein [uncultured Amphritea sp.]|uniref:SURF1 family protein n=1 Tax=uncultured Amphritea sp. TaxID=981605 RepID=UPI00262082EC|nr:SURF1 family protein [uncultured Amphritea sp.]